MSIETSAATISPNMVARLEIFPTCQNHFFPCKHLCEIALTDGRKINVALRATTIDSLIQDVASANIICKLDNNHFHHPYFGREGASHVLNRLWNQE